MKTQWIILLCSVLPLTGLAQINYSGGVYTQNFDGLQNDTIYHNYTVLPEGWVVSHSSYVWTTGSLTNGYSNNYGTFCFASGPGAADKSLGLVIGTTGPASFGAQFRNTSGVTLTSFTLRYYAEQWVKGQTTGSDQAIPFQYSIGASSLTSGTFVNVPSLAMHSVNDGDGTMSALDGNAPANRQLVSGTVTGLSWEPNQDLWIRWSGVSVPFFSSHALAVDDLSFTAVPQLLTMKSGLGSVKLSWPTNDATFKLHSTTTLAPLLWDAVTNEPTIIGGQYTVEIDASGSQQFFRLQKP